MTGGRYTVALTDLIKDPAVVEELQRIQAAFAGLLNDATREDAERGLDTGITINTLASSDDGARISGQRWLTGPWLLDADGANPGRAMLRPPAFGDDQNNFAPIGIDTCVGMELTPTANVKITGIKIKTIQRRVLMIVNRGNFDIAFPSEHPDSVENNRFEIGVPTALGVEGETLTLPARTSMWLYYDVGRAEGRRWSLFSIPAIDPENLPDSLKQALTSIPPDYAWFGARVDGGSATIRGMGEADVVTVGGTFRNNTVGIGRDFATAAIATSGNGVNTGGGAQVSPQHDPTWTLLIRTGADIGNIRIWALLTTGIPIDADDIGGGNQYFGFRYSTVAGDAGWRGVQRDNLGVQSLTASVAGIATDTIYKLKVRKSGSTFYFSVNDGTEVTLAVSADLQATAQLFWAVRWFTQNAAAKTITFYQHMVKFGNSF